MTTNQPLLNFRLAELLKFHLPKTLIVFARALPSPHCVTPGHPGMLPDVDHHIRPRLGFDAQEGAHGRHVMLQEGLSDVLLLLVVPVPFGHLGNHSWVGCACHRSAPAASSASTIWASGMPTICWARGCVSYTRLIETGSGIHASIKQPPPPFLLSEMDIMGAGDHLVHAVLPPVPRHLHDQAPVLEGHVVIGHFLLLA